MRLNFVLLKDLPRRPRHRRLRAAALALAGLLTLAACGSSSDGSGPSTPTGTQKATSVANSPEDAKASTAAADLGLVTPGELTVASGGDYKPVTFVQGGELVGFGIDSMRYVADKLGLKPTFKIMDLGVVPATVASNTVDISGSPFLATPERQQKLIFTVPVNFDPYAVVGPKDSGISSFEDLNGKVVGVTANSAVAAYLKAFHPEVQQRAFPTQEAATTAAVSGQVAATMIGHSLVGPTLEKYPRLGSLIPVDLPWPNGYTMAKERTALKAAVDQAIQSMMSDGTFLTLWKKWYPDQAVPEGFVKAYPTLATQLK